MIREDCGRGRQERTQSERCEVFGLGSMNVQNTRKAVKQLVGKEIKVIDIVTGTNIIN